ncbi:HAD family hydrolase [Streptococcus ratti]|uniref:HAD family phosphatase n=2 Tax=Streptococcus ratti TaxID=1341 RepID=A0A7X9LEK1_STRRT|nr:HAD family phosphatase [Streptococcus ratti]VEI59607.1 phosphatase [Streptococcus mutans]EJN93275.1 putative phosphatase [Streptococcus ratti FA-1 = DSM 20564]EMP68693.1 putative phosphatase [Streptococcus ratti FA-1 = DSM 20564]NMD49741.1 HAD family phosphatase [Streptococcus ratti]QEY07176.1 HAD family phosphatase [Streptococcus ratti]
MTVKAIIFDMDGVLFDTESFYYRRREVFLNSKGISIKHLPPAFFIGGNIKQAWRQILGSDYDRWDTEQLQKEYTDYKNNHPLPYKNLIFSDVKDVLERLHQQEIKIALASSSTKSDILLALSETDILSYFEFVLSGEEFPESKPNPEIYNEAARRLNIPKSDILIIEDSEKGIAAGVAAGMEVWAVKDRTFGLNQTAASRLVASLTQAVEDAF